jgi:UDP-N-acetylmuramoyl-tripeptide--D-alanyl-D-alanine ligase
VKATTLASVAAVVEGSLRGQDDPRVLGVAVDSRSIRRGDLFFALPGEQVDGHVFVADALTRGAAGAVVTRGRVSAAGPLVEVDDPGAALLRLASHARRELHAIVIGITGSTGKTCTKDFTASVLSKRMPVVASPASFNNEVGLPLTVLRADPETEALVCEMGSRGRGHIRLLCEVARPDVGVVTNVGVAHMELFGSPEALREAKAELPEALPQDGVAVLNGDDRVARGFAARTPARRVVMFGLSADAHVRADSVTTSPSTGLSEFDVVTPEGTEHVRLSVPGEHLVLDALAGAAVAWALGIDVVTIAQGLSEATVSGGRMEIVQAAGIRILNDAYNANPTSMAAALKAARWMAGDGRCVAVLGHMAELGSIAEAEHDRVGEVVARLGIDELVTIGPEARRIAASAQREGVEPDRIHMCDDVSEAIEALRSLVRPGDLVLVKASRVARLERIVEALDQGAPGAPSALRGGAR